MKLHCSINCLLTNLWWAQSKNVVQSAPRQELRWFLSSTWIAKTSSRCCWLGKVRDRSVLGKWRSVIARVSFEICVRAYSLCLVSRRRICHVITHIHQKLGWQALFSLLCWSKWTCRWNRRRRKLFFLLTELVCSNLFFALSLSLLSWTCCVCRPICLGSHKIDPLIKLDNLRVLWLPPNCTSQIQPFDQGIIRTFKAYYRKFLLSDCVRELESQIEEGKDQPVRFCLSYSFFFLLFLSWSFVCFPCSQLSLLLCCKLCDSFEMLGVWWKRRPFVIVGIMLGLFLLDSEKH